MPTEKKDQGSSSSSSDSSQLGPSLDQLFGAIARALDGLVAGDLAQREQLQRLSKLLEDTTRRTEGRISSLQADMVTFMSQVEQLVEHQRTAYNAVIDAWKVLEKSQRTMDGAIDEFREETGRHKLMKVELEKMEKLEDISSWGIRVRWVTLAKYGKLYAPLAGKVIALGTAIVAAGYEFITNMNILGWHW